MKPVQKSEISLKASLVHSQLKTELKPIYTHIFTSKYLTSKCLCGCRSNRRMAVCLLPDRRCHHTQVAETPHHHHPHPTSFTGPGCGCCWGASCCTPCGPKAGPPSLLPSPDSHPGEGRTKKRWFEPLEILKDHKLEELPDSSEASDCGCVPTCCLTFSDSSHTNGEFVFIYQFLSTCLV